MARLYHLKIFHVFILLFIAYSFIFIYLHFFQPSIGDVTIHLDESSNSSDSKVVSLNIISPPKKYYFVIFEADEKENWLYAVSPTFSSIINHTLVNKFLSSEQQDFIFLEGNKQRDEITFKLISKYASNTTATKQYVFHAYYIVPFYFFPFQPFYYSKHYTFFIDPTL